MRRLFSLFLVAFSCLFLSGCFNIKDKVDEAVRDFNFNSSKDVMQSARGKLMTKSTSDIMKAADESKKKAQDLVNEIENSWWPWHPFKQRDAVKAFNKYKDLTNDFNHALKSDSVYQKNYGTGFKTTAKKINGKALILPVVLVLVLLLLIYKLLSNTKDNGKQPVEEVVENTYTDQVKLKKVNTTDELKVNYSRLLDDVCSKMHVAKGEAIAKYGDERKAYENLSYAMYSGKEV